MSKDFIDTIKQTIDAKYHSEEARHSTWILKEINKESNQRIRMRLPKKNCFSIAFSLDCKSSKPFAFLSDSPPRHFAKMCDAILFCVHENKIYLFVVEIKTNNQGEYEKQLINGKLFCDWLIALCREHKYLDSKAEITVISLLIWEPRRSAPEGTTTHRETDHYISDTEQIFKDGHSFEVRNCDSVQIIELINRIKG